MACQALAALVLLSCILARSPLPLSLFKGLIFATLCFLMACPVPWECCTSEGELSQQRGLIALFRGGLGDQAVSEDGRKAGHSLGISAEDWMCLC